MCHRKKDATVYPKSVAAAMKSLGLLLPVVQRVHGADHPELAEVARLMASLRQSLGHPGGAEACRAAVAQLRAVTREYTLPEAACPAFQKTYLALSRLDAGIAGVER